MEPVQWILMLMANNEPKQQVSENGLEYLKGCSMCEHGNPQLERELQAFAQLLFDIWLAKQNGNENPDAYAGIDKGL
jgi:hypothetical protein